jgi:mono/diheme cytochrome c family protein
MKFSFVGRVKAAVLLATIFAALSLVFLSGASTRQVEAQRSGVSVYSQNCARCHGTDGRAQTAKGRKAKAVDFTSDDWTPDAGHDSRLVMRGKGSMPSFKGKLTTAEINAVVQYIRRFKR